MIKVLKEQRREPLSPLRKSGKDTSIKKEKDEQCLEERAETCLVEKSYSTCTKVGSNDETYQPRKQRCWR